MKTKEEVLFEDAPVFRAVLSLVVPTVVSQLITVVYNMADTFFIGQIDDDATVRYGQLFQRIICLTGPCTSVTMLAITAFQSVGQKGKPAVLSLLRKGGLDIPLMFLLNHLAGVNGIVWATPAADLGAMAAAVALFLPFWRKLSRFERESPQT